MSDTGSGADLILRDIFLAFVRIHVLYHAASEPIYGAEMIEELARHGYSLGPGTLYPLLHTLQECGYLEDEKRVVAGKVRRYYRITVAGREALAALRVKVRELVNEVLHENTPATPEFEAPIREPCGHA